jgi:hypothetical protein
MIIIISSCVKQFIPETGTDPDLIVVEGLITDQPGRQAVKISRSIPLGIEANYNPERGCNVWITDDTGAKYQLTESVDGAYLTSADFSGIVGRKYILNIEVIHYTQPFNRKVIDFTLQSSPVEMLPVPDIDSLYYEKVQIKEENGFPFPGEGCQIFLNTADPTDECKYYRWDYTETWKIVTPSYQRSINRICWITNKSDDINAKTVTGMNENRIDHQRIKFISNESDRLSERYRIQVNQYSVNEEEYNYWSDLEKITEQSGNFYDIMPSSVSGNIYCPGNPDRQVLGYFSVSSVKSKVLYIDELFKGLVDPYRDCTKDTLRNDGSPFPPEGFFDYDGILYWLVELNTTSNPSYLITTLDKGCVDCTTRGTTVKPDFWTEAWKDIKKNH